MLTFHCAQVSTGFASTTNPLSPATWLQPWAWLKFTPLRLLVSSGPPAVVLFFTLSGFVLSLPFLRSRRKPGYFDFTIKRICRIYPPFAFAILVSAALYALVHPVPIPTLSPWFNETLWDRPLSAGYILRNLMMTGLRPDMTLDLVMWSLVHELRISLIFPFLFLLTHRWPLTLLAVSLVASVVCTVALAGAEAASFGMSLVDTGRFVFLFVAGIVIAGRVDTIRSVTSRLSRTVVGCLWVGSVALMLFPGPTFSQSYNYVWGMGAAGLVMLTVGSARADRLLSASPLLWLGKVSYSLYLIHVPLLLAAVHLSYGRLPLWITIAAAIPLSLACAELMYRTVEEPSIRLGRTLAGLRLQGAAPLPSTARSVARRSRR